MPIRLLDPHKGIFLDEVDSTQERIQSKEYEPGSWIVAKSQTQGKGRKGRVWKMIGDEFLIFSGKNELRLTDLPVTLLSLLAASSLLKAIFQWYPEKQKECQLKWPNDIYRNGKKIAGFLLDSQIHQDRFQVVVGFGLNLYGKELSPDLPNAGFLLDYPPFDGAKERILYSFIEFWNESLQKVAGYKELGRELEWLEKNTMGIGESIQFYREGQKKVGKVLGFDTHGFLVVLDMENGMKYTFMDTEEGMEYIKNNG